MKILHLDTNHPLLIEQLAQLGFDNDEEYTAGKSEVEARLHEYDGAVIRSRFRIDREFLSAGKRLKFVARVGSGLENIDVDAAAELGIKVIAAPEGNCNAVGEHALALLLNLINHIKRADMEVRRGLWYREANRGTELEGKVIGIIGYGNTGKAFAKKLSGFDAEVICQDIKPDVGDNFAAQVSLNELKSTADIISLHVPLTELTRGMIDRDFIDQCDKRFWFLNTARGENVITTDLVDGLRSGQILGVGLDVLEYEKISFENLEDEGSYPEPFRYLIRADNVILTPHIAGWTTESKRKLAEVVVRKIRKLFGE